VTPEDARARDLIQAQAHSGRASLRAFVRMAWGEVEPNPLRWSWHMDAVACHLEAVSRGEIRDLVICVPPGTSKSLLASTLWPAWVWCSDPTKKFLAVTYGQKLSNKNARLMRDLVASPWYQSRWTGAALSRDQVSLVEEFKNASGGWRVSSSVGGRATGIHADVHIGDDLAKAQDAEGRNHVDPQAIEKANDFWFKTMATRRADAATLCRVMIAQRLHHDDTPGRCIEAGYTALVLPMEYDSRRRCTTSVLWTCPEIEIKAPTRFEDPRTRDGALLVPSRFPRDTVEADKKTLGPITHEAQNQQNPTPHEGAIFKNAGRNRWTTVPTANATKIITVDCAFKDTKTSDFVAIQVWVRAGTNFYLVDREHGRWGFSATVAKILEVAARHPRAAIHIEDKANGPAVIEVLRGEVPGVVPWSPGQDSKVGRAEAVAHLFDAGNVWLPPDDQAPWIGEYLATLGRFPLVKYDDDVDATTQALLILHRPFQRQFASGVAALGRLML
jgi:predicted phage terminase large subunit-like protein